MDDSHSILVPKNYVRNGKIMLYSVVVLVSVVMVMFCFHSCSGCFSLRRRLPHRRQQRQIRLRRLAHQLVFRSDDSFPYAAGRLENQGLELRVLKSLPAFIYDSKTRDPPPECAVCWSEFEDNERGRLLPNCAHSFHIDCIDTWFQSHSNCPLCRSPVQLHISKPAKLEIEPGGLGTKADLESGDGERVRSLSSSQRNKSAHCLADTVVEVERRDHSSRSSSSEGDQYPFKNSGNRVSNLKRFWSI